MDLTNLKAIYDKQDADALANERHQENKVAILDLQATVVQAFQTLTDYLDQKVGKTEVVNPVYEVSTPDVQDVVDAVQVLARMMIENKLDLNPVQQGIADLSTKLEQLNAGVSGLPTEYPEIEIPEQKDEIKVTNLGEIDFTTLEKAIKGIKMVAEAPQINVDAPDLSPLKKSLADVIKAVKGIEFPEIPKTDLSTVEKKLDKSNKLLKEIVEKPVSSGGGGGGRATPYQDSTGLPVFPTLSNGAIQITQATLTKRFDTSSSTIVYTATAPVGTLDSSLGWTITKFDLTNASDSSGKVATDVSWLLRATGSYN